VTYIDAYGLVALIANEPAAAEVEQLLRSDECRVVAVNLAEAVDVSARIHGYPLDDIRKALEPLFLGEALAVAVSDEPEAWVAAEIRVAEYNKKTRPLSMADCLLLAHVALTDDAVLATSDPDLAAVARSRAITVVGLPDRAGSLP